MKNKLFIASISALIVLNVSLFLVQTSLSSGPEILNELPKPIKNNVSRAYEAIDSKLSFLNNEQELPAEQKPKESTQSLVKIESKSSLTAFISANDLKESDITASRSLPGTYIVSSPKSSLVTVAGADVTERKQYNTLYDFTSQDTNYPQWYTDAIRAPEVWNTTTGNEAVTVAVIDTGFALNHEDLQGRWAAGGRDFANNDNNPMAGTTNPTGGAVSHGTNVAGLIGATGNNGLGVASVNWQTKILPLQALSDGGSGWTDDVTAAVNYAVSSGAKVINLSLGSPGEDPVLKQAIDQAVGAGVTVVAAAGNCGSTSYAYQGCSYRGEVLYPAKYSNVIAVAATDSLNNRASFSSYSPEVDVSAPGSGTIISTKWQQDNTTSAYTSSLYGTSFSSPIVAGIAALHVGENANITPAELREALISSAKKVPAMNGAFYSDYFGYGLVDIYKSFNSAKCQNSTNELNQPAGKSIIGTRQRGKSSAPLAFVQKNLTDTKCAELNIWNSGYKSWKHNVTTNAPTTQSAFGDIISADTNGDGNSEFLLIQGANTGSGMIEIRTWDSTYQAWSSSVITNLSTASYPSGYVIAADTDGNGKDELHFVKQTGTGSRMIEIHTWADGYKKWVVNRATNHGQISKDRGYVIAADTDGNGKDELHLILQTTTGSKKIEVHTWVAGYRKWSAHIATNLGQVSKNIGYVIAADTDGNGKDELHYIMQSNTGSGKIEVHRWVAGYKRWYANIATNLNQF